MAKIDAARLWALNYQLSMQVIAEVAPRVAELGVEVKELFLLAAVDEVPHPAALAAHLVMPKPTVTAYVKRLVAAGFLTREIDPDDLRRHRLTLTTSGREVTSAGRALLSEAYGTRLQRLTGGERAELKRLLEKLG